MANRGAAGGIVFLPSVCLSSRERSTFFSRFFSVTLCFRLYASNRRAPVCTISMRFLSTHSSPPVSKRKNPGRPLFSRILASKAIPPLHQRREGVTDSLSLQGPRLHHGLLLSQAGQTEQVRPVAIWLPTLLSREASLGRAVYLPSCSHCMSVRPLRHVAWLSLERRGICVCQRMQRHCRTQHSTLIPLLVCSVMSVEVGLHTTARRGHSRFACYCPF